MQAVVNTAPPPARDRMSGQYHIQCPGCRAHKSHGPDCVGGSVTPRLRRRVEKAALFRYLRSQYD